MSDTTADESAVDDGIASHRDHAPDDPTTAATPDAAIPNCPRLPCVAMVGNPNVGKTSVFNRLTNLLTKTSNFAGTTIEKRSAILQLANGRPVELVDLPGAYSLEASSPEEQVARDFLSSADGDGGGPSAMVIVVDATNLQRSLFLARQALQLDLPAIVIVNFIESARRQGIEIDATKLSTRLGCPVVGVSARTGEGFDALMAALAKLTEPRLPQIGNTGVRAAGNGMAEACSSSCGGCAYADGHQWAATLAREATHRGATVSDETTDRIDSVLTGAVVGPAVFAMMMLATFSLVFWVAQTPMEWLDAAFAWMSQWVAATLPAGDFQSLITDGLIGGVGGVVVFLPQICLLFFALAVLEDSGYLARAVVVIDRWMRRVGLPGQAFVPLLAAHACAIPAIMSTKVIQNRRDRLAAIMVIPLMTCSARLPVYTMVAAMLFPQAPLYAALLFASAYGLGMVAAFGASWVFKRTLLPGQASPLIMDLPPYRMPSISNAFRHAYERGWMFLRDAGSIILMISIGIWGLSTYPKMPAERIASTIAQRGIQLDAMDETQVANLEAQLSQEHALIGRIGKTVAPVFAPLGFDWKTSVGVMTSFAAREVVVSTLSILYGLGPEPDGEASLHQRLSAAKHPDGSPVFTTATCFSLLVFFVLAMQCLPTQAVTKKETGSWGWAILQFTYMTVLAYVAAWATYQTLSMWT